MKVNSKAYFVMTKRCSNACSLQFFGSDYVSAVQKAEQKSRNLRLATYVLTSEQIDAIFDSQNDKILSWQRDKNFNDECYLELPSNFKKHLR